MLRKRSVRIVVVLAVVFVLSACENTFTTRGSSERSRVTVGSAYVEKSFRQAEGAITQRFDIEYGGRYEVHGSLEVEEGAFVLKLLDADDSVAMTLEAAPGQPDSGTATIKTNFGLVRYQIHTEGAKGVRYRLDFTAVD